MYELGGRNKNPLDSNGAHIEFGRHSGFSNSVGGTQPKIPRQAEK